MQRPPFIVVFFKHPKQVGTLTQSSKFLAKKMAQEIDGAGHIIEFGPGSGTNIGVRGTTGRNG